MTNDSQEFFFIGRFCLQRNLALVLQVVYGGINADLLPQLKILPPDQRFGIAELRQPAKRGRIEVRIRSDSQILQDLVQAIRGNRSQMRRLSYVCPEHLGQARAEPVQRLIARGVAERKNRQCDRFLRSARLSKRIRKEVIAEDEASKRQQHNAKPGGDPFASDRCQSEPGREQGSARARARRPSSLQVLQDFRRALIAKLGVNLQALDYNLAQEPGHSRIDFHGRDNLLLEAFQQCGRGSVCLEG